MQARPVMFDVVDRIRLFCYRDRGGFQGGETMKRMLLLTLPVFLILVSVLEAVEPTDRTEQTSGTSALQRSELEGGPLPFPEQIISGDVTVGNTDTPLGGVMVKLFADGRLVDVAHTASSGSYDLSLPLNVEEDETVVLWFMATSGNYLPSCVVLKESSRARKANIFSKCVLRVEMRPQMQVDVRLMTEGELVASLKNKKCL